MIPVLLVSWVAHANPAIDMQGYLEVSREAAAHRQSRRLSEEEFIRMSREPGTLVQEHAHPNLLQQQLRQRRGTVPGEDRARLAQPLDLHRALQLRLPQCLRARPAH
jgi:hypothetical protein